MIYNERDESDPFTAAYGDLVRAYALDDTERRRADGLEMFAAFEGWHAPRRIEVRNEQPQDLEGVLARARSTSYLPKTGLQADELHAAIRALFAQHARAGRVTMTMRTIVAIGDVLLG